MTIHQAALHCGIPGTSLRDLVARGHLPAVRLPDTRRIWIRRVDLDRLITDALDVAR